MCSAIVDHRRFLHTRQPALPQTTVVSAIQPVTELQKAYQGHRRFCTHLAPVYRTGETWKIDTMTSRNPRDESLPETETRSNRRL